MNFKHYIIFTSKDIEQKTSYIKELTELGYKPYGLATLSTNENVVKTYGGTHGVYNTFDHVSGIRDSVSREFNGNEEWQYYAALAIAAIHTEDNIPYVGEWIYCGSKSSTRHGQLEKLAVITWAENEVDGLIGTYGSKSDSRLNTNGNRKATPEEIIEFFKNKYGMKAEAQQKIIGYKILKDGPGFSAGTELKVPIQLKGGLNGWADRVREKATDRVLRFPEDIIKSSTHWFEPIYEEVIVKRNLVVGSNNMTITLNSNGEIKTPWGTTDIKEIQAILDHLIPPKLGISLEIIAYGVSVMDDWRFIRIGCEKEDNRFSPEELKMIIKTYQEIKKK